MAWIEYIILFSMMTGLGIFLYWFMTYRTAIRFRVRQRINNNSYAKDYYVLAGASRINNAAIPLR